MTALVSAELFNPMGFPGGQTVKNPPAVQEAQVRSLGREDPRKKGITTRSSILAWEIPQTEESGGLQAMGSQRVDTTERLTCTHSGQFTACLNNCLQLLTCLQS